MRVSIRSSLSSAHSSVPSHLCSDAVACFERETLLGLEVIPGRVEGPQGKANSLREVVESCPGWLNQGRKEAKGGEEMRRERAVAAST